jgi:multidrug resistance efflux pump
MLSNQIKGEDAMPDHEDQPPSTLAHGAVKSGEIERVRRDVDKSQARVVHDTKITAARKEQELRRKDTSEEDAEA